MKFHEWDCQHLNALFGRDLGWEYGVESNFDMGTLPNSTPIEIARQCRRFVDLRAGGDNDINEFCDDEQFDRVKTAELISVVREKLGIVASFAGKLRTWADSQDLTAYEIGKRLDEGGENPVKQRWQRWLSKDGLKTIETLQADLNALGYTLSIQPKA